jgi:hypothetical protein
MNKIPLTNSWIYEFDLNVDLIDRCLEKFTQQKNLHTKVSNPGVVNTANSVFAKENGKHLPIYDKELFDELQKFVDEVSALHFNDLKLVICDSWLSKARFGEISNAHTHAFSIFSGLVYLTEHPKSETSFFVLDRSKEDLVPFFNPVLKDQGYTYNYKPTKGKCLIWRSTIPHQITAHTDKTTRYALAFNTWPSGLISKYETARLIANVEDVSQQIQSN